MRRSGKTFLLFQKMRELQALGWPRASLLYVSSLRRRLPSLRREPRAAGDILVSTEEHAPAAGGERPALVELDDGHLLLVYAEGSAAMDAGPGSAQRLRIAVVDVDRGGIVSSSPLVPKSPPYDTDTTLRQGRPAAARVGERVFVAWDTESPQGDPLGHEAWLAEIE
jgi:hypothetical protein